MKRRINYTLPINLNLGSADITIEGYQGLDIDDYGQAIVWDATQGLPFPDNTIDNLCSSHFIEHIADRDIFPLFLEIIRVCKNGSIVDFSCPHSDSNEAYYPDHVSYWNQKRVWGFFQAFGQYKERVEVLECRHNTGERDIYFKLKVVK